MDLNRVMLIGNVTRDPEVRTTPQGATVATFSVATNKTWTDASGVRQEKAEYHNVVAWRKSAELVQQLVRKGTKVFVEGELQTRSWDDPSGVKKYRTEIVLNNFIMLSPRGQAGSAMPGAGTTHSAPINDPFNDLPTQAPEEDIRLEDVPF